MERVAVATHSLEAYRGIAADAVLDEIAAYAARLRGLRVAHLNATPSGGGVAELLKSFVPLQRGAGLDADWYVLEPDQHFFDITKKIHNTLQGQPGELTPEERRYFLAHNERTATQMAGFATDVWVIHDPQPVAVIAYRDIHPAIWRCHIDTSTPNPSVRDFLLPYIREYDATIFSLAQFALPGLDSAKLAVFTPAIDALVAKNAPLPRDYAKHVVRKFGPDPTRPLVTQVSRFDPWKDPVGVVEAFRLARQRVPGLQLAMVGMTAADDPESTRVYAETEAYVGADPDVFMLTERDRVFDFEVNAFQTASDVVIQKSLREGFGLTVSEAMWKGTPVIGGNVGGIRAQIQDGLDGFLVSSVSECAERIVTLLQDHDLARRMGERGRDRVRENFLMPTLVLNYMRLIAKVAGR
jgi:trehalose synthase